MRKDPNARWIKLHTIAKLEKGAWYSSEGLIAIVDGDEAGIVGFACDSYFGFELGVDMTEQPWPQQLFEIPEWVNPWDYISREDYVNHPQVANFSPEINWMWEGTAAELFYAAQNNTDLMFPDRKLNERDCDYNDMMALYTNIRGYLAKRDKKKKQKAKGSLNSNKGGGFSEIFPLDDDE